MREEEWRDIEGYKGLYQISSYGRVKSLERMKRNSRGYHKIPERILKPYVSGHGYLQVQLYKEGNRKPYHVHRLVATAFLENTKGYTEVNHKDENKQNNHMDNLEWCSHSYNNSYNDKGKKAGKKISKPVYSVNKESGLITYWESAKVAGRILGIDSSHITKCCKGKMKSIGGFYWMYAEEEN